jgi:hypothetical protein
VETIVAKHPQEAVILYLHAFNEMNEARANDQFLRAAANSCGAAVEGSPRRQPWVR